MSEFEFTRVDTFLDDINREDCFDTQDMDGKTLNYRIYQQFVILENEQMAKWQEKVSISFIEKYDENHTVARFAVSWATTKEEIEELEKELK